MFDQLARNNTAIGLGSRDPGMVQGDSWESMNVYDAPGTVISQVLGGEAGWNNLVGAMVDPNRLTPAARLDLGARFAGGVENPVAKAAIGLATNPWVWLYFVTSPVGGAALRAGGSLFKVQKAYSMFQKQGLGLLHQLKSNLEIYGESSGTAMAITRNLDKSAQATKGVVAGAEVALQNKLTEVFVKQYGKKPRWIDGPWMVASRYEVGTPERDMLEQVGLVAGSRSSGAIDGRVLKVSGTKFQAFRKRKGEDGKIVEEWVPHLDGLKVDGIHSDIEQSKYMMLKTVEEEMRGKSRDAFYALAKSEDPNKRAIYARYIQDAEWEVQNAAPDELARVEFTREGSRHPDATQLAPNEAFEILSRDRAIDNFWKDSDEFFEADLKSLGGVEDAAPVPKVADGVRLAKLAEPIEKELGDFMTAWDKANKDRFVEALGDEAHYAETGMFRMDREKTFRLISSFNRNMNVKDPYGKMTSTIYGMDALVQLLGVERVKGLKIRGDVVRQLENVAEEVERIVGGDHLNWNVGNWSSRNVFTPARNEDGTRMLLQLGDVVQEKAFGLAPHAASASNAKNVAPITPKEVWFSEDYLDLLEKHGALTEEGRAHRALVRKTGVVMRTRAKDQSTLMTWDPSRYAESNDRHQRGLTQLHAFDTAPAAEEAFIDDANRIRNMREDLKSHRTQFGVIGNWRLDWAFKSDGKDIVGRTATPWRVSNGDILDRIYSSIPSPAAQEIFRSSAVPSMIGNAGDQYLALYNAQIRTKEMAGWWAKSPLGEGVKKYGGEWGKKLVTRLENIGSFDMDTKLGNVSDGLAKWLYASHLGLNVSSMLMNLTQPLLLAATVSKNPMDVLKAYGEAIGEMGTYARKRIGMGGRFITAEEKANLVRQSFEHADDLGIGPDMFQSLDSHLAASKGTATDRMFEVFMKGFEKTEWMNRVVAGKILKNAYKGVGRAPTGDLFRSDLRRFVLQTQFGQSDMNTPLVFEKGILSNRLVRQFFTFPLRSFVGTTQVFPQLQTFEGDPSVVKNMANMFFRGMGMSAMLYEVGKGLVGADLSKGLFAGSLTGIAGGDRLPDPESSPIPVPPVVAIPVDLIRGWANDDSKLMQSAVARMVPGGVAINRAMGFMPEMPRTGMGGGLGALQTQSVGWDEMQNGLVPVYNGEGLLKEYRSPAEVVAKAVGADLGTWKQQGELDNWLVKHKKQIDGMRHEAIRALYVGDMGRVAKLKAEFQKKFKVPLTISKAQLKEYTRNRATSRTERILDSYGTDVRQPYAAAVAGSGSVRGMDPTVLSQGGSASSRDALRPGLEERMREVEARRNAVGPEGRGGGSSFRGFKEE